MKSSGDGPIGLLGGTFDPIHLGHLRLALTACEQGGLERVLVIPNNAPPHKYGAQAAPEQRAAMAAIAIAPYPQLELSRVELDRPGRSYMIDTVALLRSQLGAERELLLITGADAILEITTWYQAERLRQELGFLAAARPGFDLSAIAALPEAWRQRITVIPMEEADVSSSEIRRRLRAGQPVRGLLPEPVERYIIEKGLYQEDRVF